MIPADLYASPNALAPHYSRFRVSERLLLTGHSHQAWPDVGFEGQQQAWLDAAEHADDKWEPAFAMADRCRRGWARLLDDAPGRIALGASTHDLLVRWLSALPLRERPRIVTTDGEYHSARRQLDRLAEEGIDVVKVPHLPASEVAPRIASSVNDRTAAVVVSAVFYQNAHIVPGLADVMRACRTAGAELLVDAYHALNAIPFTLGAHGLTDAFVTGGGYKYCQLGEGNGFLRIPEGCTMRPVVTGWYSEFTGLAEPTRPGVPYGEGPDRFAGATYDPTSHYRAARVFDFFREQGLAPEVLRDVSRHQVATLAAAFDALDLDPGMIARDRDTDLDGVGGFLALRTPRAAELQRALRERGVRTDHRGELLRFGPAPYLTDGQLRAAMGALGAVVREVRGAAPQS